MTASAYGTVNISAPDIPVFADYPGVQSEFPGAPPLTISGTITGINFTFGVFGYTTAQMPLNVLARRGRVTLSADAPGAFFVMADAWQNFYPSWNGNFSGDGYLVDYANTNSLYLDGPPQNGDTNEANLSGYGSYYGADGAGTYWNYNSYHSFAWQVSGRPELPAPAAGSGRAFISAFDSVVWSNLANSTQTMYDKTGAAAIIPSGTLVGTGTLFNW